MRRPKGVPATGAWNYDVSKCVACRPQQPRALYFNDDVYVGSVHEESRAVKA